MGIISISETDSLLQLELQCKQICLYILSIDKYHININTDNITSKSTDHSDGNKFVDGVEVFQSAYVFFTLIGWVSGRKLCSVSRKISGRIKSLWRMNSIVKV